MPKRRKNRTQKFDPLDPNQKIEAVEAFRLARDWAIANHSAWEPHFHIMWSEGKWCVSSKSAATRSSFFIYVCPKAGNVLDVKNFHDTPKDRRQKIDQLDAKPKFDPVHAFRIAHEWAVANSALWEPGFSVNWAEGKWCIATNSLALGCNLFIDVSPHTGEIVRIFWNPE